MATATTVDERKRSELEQQLQQQLLLLDEHTREESDRSPSSWLLLPALLTRDVRGD